MSTEAILEKIEPYRVKHVLLTGGEPLLQRQTPSLLEKLQLKGYQVSIETHGEVSIEKVAQKARIILDIKTPSSGMSRGGYLQNFRFLKKQDEVKFVIASESDYDWAKKIVLEGNIPTEEILLSPAVTSKGMPGIFSGVQPRWLAEKILEDRLPVRMQIQLHKLLWGADQKGV